MSTEPSVAAAGKKGRRLGEAQGEGTKSLLWLVLLISAFVAYRGLEFVGVPQARSGSLAFSVLLFFAWAARSRRAKLLLSLALPSVYLLVYIFFGFVGVPEAERSALAFACVFLPLVACERRAKRKASSVPVYTPPSASAGASTPPSEPA